MGGGRFLSESPFAISFNFVGRPRGDVSWRAWSSSAQFDGARRAVEAAAHGPGFRPTPRCRVQSSCAERTILPDRARGFRVFTDIVPVGAFSHDEIVGPGTVEQ